MLIRHPEPYLPVEGYRGSAYHRYIPLFADEPEPFDDSSFQSIILEKVKQEKAREAAEKNSV